MTTALVKNGWSLAPSTFSEARQFADLIANSDLAPKDYRGKPGNILVCVQMGADVGLSPMQALSSIAVINGRPALYGDGMLAVCQSSESFEDIQEEVKDGVATCTVKRKGRSPTVRTFSVADAKAAGLLGKQGPWTQYQTRMLQMRARAFALRDAFADVLRGIQSAEEVSDYPKEVRAEVVETKPAQLSADQPKQERKSDPPPAAAAKPVGPVFALSWPDKQWAGKLLKEAPDAALTDYAAWCESIIADASRQRLHKKAQASLDEVAAEIDLRIEQEAAKASAEAGQQEQGDNTPVEQGRDSWGLTP